jgi:hypothetical protein
MRGGCISRSSHLTRILFLLLAGDAAAALLAQARPDLSGVWKLRSTRARYSEIWTVKQTARDIRIQEMRDVPPLTGLGLLASLRLVLPGAAISAAYTGSENLVESRKGA